MYWPEFSFFLHRVIEIYNIHNKKSSPFLGRYMSFDKHIESCSCHYSEVADYFHHSPKFTLFLYVVSLLPPYLVLGSYWSNFCLHSFVFTTPSYKWSHIILGLFVSCFSIWVQRVGHSWVTKQQQPFHLSIMFLRLGLVAYTSSSHCFAHSYSIVWVHHNIICLPIDGHLGYFQFGETSWIKLLLIFAYRCLCSYMYVCRVAVCKVNLFLPLWEPAKCLWKLYCSPFLLALGFFILCLY